MVGVVAVALVDAALTIGICLLLVLAPTWVCVYLVLDDDFGDDESEFENFFGDDDPLGILSLSYVWDAFLDLTWVHPRASLQMDDMAFDFGNADAAMGRLRHEDALESYEAHDGFG
eukprot:1503872-Amphidinium_carterae.1